MPPRLIRWNFRPSDVAIDRHGRLFVANTDHGRLEVYGLDGYTDPEAFAPAADELEMAIEILAAAQAAQWAPIRHRDTLHDRASYRYFWQVVKRARRTAQPLPAQVELALFGTLAG